MNIDDIKNTIPHRSPFLFVDEVMEISDEKIIARRTIKPDEFYFQGHFPGEPIMPGVLIVEAIAQTGGVLLLRKRRGAIPLFMGIDKARFRKIVRPGDTLVIEVEILHDRGTVAKIKGVARVEDAVVCETTIIAGIKKP
ncbi:MAG: 3-hydroxyacyl-ACP dehydratase FabZ [candidate division WOR-3 bacterium]|nr:MAG: 3-hydroxyacyl-ACP dehydratase FabZ [candidate division WOR-3 bacterium]